MSVNRKLVAVFYADVAGYSRLTGADEVGTHRRVMAMLDDVTAQIGAAGGTVLRYAGDAVLATFPSVVLAVDTAAEIQAALADSNVDIADDERIQIRIGINLGDVIEDRGEVYGDGVNLAARLEAAAEPGGICIAASAHDQVEGKATVRFTDGGEQDFKNIEKPVRVFRWRPGAAARVPAVPAASSQNPSIAVLPFNNMSGDPEQEYFSDGITEDIITELSRFRSLFVIARNSSFTFKGAAIDVKEVGDKLGVAYVVEGSVRKAGDRVRVTAQLIETATGSHVWAERYDRVLEDIFAIQDEITREVTTTVVGHVDASLQRHASRLSVDELRAYDLILRSNAIQSKFTPESNREARELLERAAEHDPTSSQTLGRLSINHVIDWLSNWVEDADRSMRIATDLGRRAVELDNSDAIAHWALGEALAFSRDFEGGVRHMKRAVALNPNDVEVRSMLGLILAFSAAPAEGIRELEEARRIDPADLNWLPWMFGCALFIVGDHEGVVRELDLIQDKHLETLAYLAASHAFLGHENQAKAALEDFLTTAEREFAVFPGRSLSSLRAYWNSFKIFKDQAVADSLAEGLRQAGLPE